MSGIHCPHCDARIETDARYCPRCGGVLEAAVRCPACGAATQAGNRFCAKCGHPLPDVAAAGFQPMPPRPAESLGGAAGQGPEDALTRRLEDRLKGVESRLENRLSRLGGAPPPASAPGAPAQRMASAPGRAPLIHQAELGALLELDPSEARQAAALVMNSRMVDNNVVYRKRVNTISFFFAEGDDSVNAFATDQPVGLSDGSQIKPPALVFCGGLARAFHLGAAAMAVYLNTRDEMILRQTFREMGQVIIQAGGDLTHDDYFELVGAQLIPIVSEQLQRGQERFVSLAQSIRMSMDMEVIAHEVGHVVLCHTLGRPVNYDVSRNQEREADSVASSILSTCPYREYHFLGQVLGNIIFVWMEQLPDSAPQATTHPLSRERFANAFNSNSDAAREADEAFGLSRRKLEQLLPDGA